jgi:hypothetical protein
LSGRPLVSCLRRVRDASRPKPIVKAVAGRRRSMRSVDESEIGSTKVLPPEELRLSWWQNFFYVAGSLTTSRETQRRSVGSSTNCSRHFLLSEGRSACVLLLGLDITSGKSSSTRRKRKHRYVQRCRQCKLERLEGERFHRSLCPACLDVDKRRRRSERERRQLGKAKDGGTLERDGQTFKVVRL